MATVSRITGEDVTSRYETTDVGTPGTLFSEFQAHDRATNRVVRLRALQGRSVHPDLVEAIADTMTQVHGVSHPAVERVLDVVRHGTAVAVVTEPVRGTDLAARVRKVGAFPVGYSLEVVLAVAEALKAAHDAGIAHGRLTAESVYLSAEGVVKVAGLGEAAAVAAAPPSARPPGYPAPDSVSARGDLRAVGELLFHLLAGQQAEGETNPAAVSSRVPTPVANMVRSLLEPSPRYQQMDDLVRELRALRRAILTGEPLPAIPPPPPAPTGKRRRPAREQPADRVADAALYQTVVGSSRPRRGRATRKAMGAIPAVLTDAATGIRRAARGQVLPEIEQEDAAPVRPVTLRGIVLRTLAWLLLLVFIPPALAVGGMVYLNYLASTPEITIPSLRGRSLEQATDQLKNLGLKIVADSTGAYDSTVPPGYVLRQSPAPGVHTKAPRTIQVTLSLGSRYVFAPNVVGKPQDEARAMTIGAGLSYRRNGDIGSAAVPYGGIAKQWPPAGRKLLRGSRLFVLVSAGPSADQLIGASPDMPHQLTISLPIPHAKQTGFHLFGGDDDRHTVKIVETSAGGAEQEMWHATMHGGETFTHDITVYPNHEVKVTLDGREVRLRQQEDADGGAPTPPPD